MKTATRTWTRLDHPDRSITWTASDGRAEVKVLPDGAGEWEVEMYEDGSCIGSERHNLYRSTAVIVAKRWLRALARPID